MESYSFETKICNRLRDIKENISYLTEYRRRTDEEIKIIIDNVKDSKYAELILPKLYRKLIDAERIEPFIGTEYERQLYHVYFYDISPRGWGVDEYRDKFDELKALYYKNSQSDIFIKTILASVFIQITEEVIEWSSE